MVKWTEKEINRLKEFYRKNRPIKEIVRKLGRSKNSICKKAQRLNLTYKGWSKEEIKYLKNNLDKSNKEIANKLDRSADGVAHKLMDLGIKRSEEQLSKIMKNRDVDWKKGKESHRWKGGKPKGKCKRCGKEFIGEHGNPNEYCSVKCFAQDNKKKGEDNYFWSGGEKNWKKEKYLYSSSKWSEIRKKIIERDGCCQICGSEDNLIVHHKVRYKNGGKNTPENLITLCQKHHSKLHSLEVFYKNNSAPRGFKRLFKELKRKEKKR